MLEGVASDNFDQIQDRLNQLIDALTALSGLVMESMLRGEAWLFLDIGRRLERGLLLIASLRATAAVAHAPPVETALLAAMLSVSESLMAYRRGYNTPPEISSTLALLLLNETNPRALMFQLASLEKHVAALPRDPGTTQMSVEARCVMEAATSLRLSDLAQLTFVDTASGLRGSLDQTLVRVERLLQRTSEALGRDYFTDKRGPQQLLGTESPP